MDISPFKVFKRIINHSESLEKSQGNEESPTFPYYQAPPLPVKALDTGLSGVIHYYTQPMDFLNLA